MKKKKSYSSGIISVIIGLVFTGVCVPLLIWIRSLLHIEEGAGLVEMAKTVGARILDPYPINPDNTGAVLVSLLGFILLVAGAAMVIAGICRLLSTAANNRSGKESVLSPVILFIVSLALAAGAIFLVKHGLDCRAALDKPFVHLFIDAAIVLAVSIVLLVTSLKKLGNALKFNRSVDSLGLENAMHAHSMGMKASGFIANTSIHILLVIMSIVWLIPFVCIILQSFRVELAMPVGYVWPEKWGLDNYAALLKTDFPKWYLNTFIMGLVVAVLQTVIVLCMSYVLSRFRFKMRKPLMRFMLILGFFPGILAMIILYRVLKDLGMTQANAVPGLILVYVASSGMGYYVSKGFLDTIPKSLDEAALVDGATRAQILFRIILPLAKPIIIYTVLTAFMGPWGDFVFARYISMNTSAGMNVAVGLNSWLSLDQINTHYTMFCAGGVIVAIPVTILFLCLQRYYVEGVTGGAVKG